MTNERLHDRIDWQVGDGIAMITLDRPEAGNALDEATARGLHEAAERVTDLAAGGEIRAAVIRASGAVFTVGGDLNEFGGADDRGAQVAATAEQLHLAIESFTQTGIPVISVVHGTAAGGGIGIALCADIIIAAQEAKFVLAYTGTGLTPDCGSTWVVPQRAGTARALDLAMTNRPITGATAADWGLISRAVPADGLEAELDDVLSGVRRASRHALSKTKRLIRQSRELSLREALEREVTTIASTITEPDGIEGVDAFLAKRRASFS